MYQNVARQNVALPKTSRDKTSRFKTSRNQNVARVKRRPESGKMAKFMLKRPENIRNSPETIRKYISNIKFDKNA
jgi:hypothetical protein